MELLFFFSCWDVLMCWCVDVHVLVCWCVHVLMYRVFDLSHYFDIHTYDFPKLFGRRLTVNTESALRSAFKLFDSTNSGDITPAEMRQVRYSTLILILFVMILEFFSSWTRRQTGILFLFRLNLHFFGVFVLYLGYSFGDGLLSFRNGSSRNHETIW